MSTTDSPALVALAAHRPEVDWGYEWVHCSCGWRDPDSVGVRTVKDGSRSWPDHQRRAVRAALGVSLDDVMSLAEKAAPELWYVELTRLTDGVWRAIAAPDEIGSVPEEAVDARDRDPVFALMYLAEALELLP